MSEKSWGLMTKTRTRTRTIRESFLPGYNKSQFRNCWSGVTRRSLWKCALNLGFSQTQPMATWNAGRDKKQSPKRVLEWKTSCNNRICELHVLLCELLLALIGSAKSYEHFLERINKYFYCFYTPSHGVKYFKWNQTAEGIHGVVFGRRAPSQTEK